MKHNRATIARALAAAFTAGALDEETMTQRGALLLGKRWRWLRPLARRICVAWHGKARPRQAALVQFLLLDAGLIRATRKHSVTLVDRIGGGPEMAPMPIARPWEIPPLANVGALAAWLELGQGDLDWFADVRAWENKRSHGRLRHYHYRALAKRFGRVRMIEAPKPRLKQLQRRILTEILEAIPVHAAVHGFRRGRSIRSFASPHVGQAAVLRMDLEDFFARISSARVQAVFRTVGYPEAVAERLAGMCTNAPPADAWDHLEVAADRQLLREARWLYARPHLPQGAPTSPALANLCAYRLDCRLTALAVAAGGTYSRYADDLAFSGDSDFARCAERFVPHVAAIAMDEGFGVHHHKTRIMPAGGRQHLAGLVVNQHVNIPRAEYDRLKATLTNCIKLGAASQNRLGHGDFRAHLLGRVSFVEMVNPARGQRLRKLFAQIAWDEPARPA